MPTTAVSLIIVQTLNPKECVVALRADTQEVISMRYIEAPGEIAADTPKRLFVAGGITGCPDWQQEYVRLFKDTDYTLLNPRRANFPIGDPGAALAQITWEHFMLRHAHLISFWFCKESICPIVLYELGAWSVQDTPIVVGIEEGYARSQDVKIQTQLARPQVPIVYSLEDLANEAMIAMEATWKS